MQLDKKPRKFRMERVPEPEIHDETGHLWAISYADFLMVLLSFFILFFSFGEKGKEDMISRISALGNPVDTKPTPKDVPDPQLRAEILEINKELKDYFVERSPNNKQVIVFLPDNIFSPGEFEMKEAQLLFLTQVMEKIRPFENDINITFVGHTDPQPVRRTRSVYMTDNFDLSSLRATKALQQAARLGFNTDHMFAKGTATNIRGSRTISVVIQPREVTL